MPDLATPIILRSYTIPGTLERTLELFDKLDSTLTPAGDDTGHSLGIPIVAATSTRVFVNPSALTAAAPASHTENNMCVLLVLSFAYLLKG